MVEQQACPSPRMTALKAPMSMTSDAAVRGRDDRLEDFL
jgi:hypothetical protein